MKLKLLIKSPRRLPQRKSDGEKSNVTYHHEVFECGESHCLVGRSNSQLIIQDVRCSRQHLLLFEDYEGRLQLKDLQSTNGSFVNGERVQARQLKIGDEIRIGKVFISVLDFGQAPPRVETAEIFQSKTPATQGDVIENNEPTQTKTGVVAVPDKPPKPVSREVESESIDYVDKDGVKRSMQIKDFLAGKGK
jgi:pSer/pThr/pTyr-binding forkhead associated (FHA) protein